MSIRRRHPPRQGQQEQERHRRPHQIARPDRQRREVGARQADRRRQHRGHREQQHDDLDGQIEPAEPAPPQQRATRRHDRRRQHRQRPVDPQREPRHIGGEHHHRRLHDPAGQNRDDQIEPERPPADARIPLDQTLPGGRRIARPVLEEGILQHQGEQNDPGQPEPGRRPGPCRLHEVRHADRRRRPQQPGAERDPQTAAGGIGCAIHGWRR